MRVSPDHSREPAALLLRSEARVDSAPDFHADAWFVPQAESYSGFVIKVRPRAKAG